MPVRVVAIQMRRAASTRSSPPGVRFGASTWRRISVDAAMLDYDLALQIPIVILVLSVLGLLVCAPASTPGTKFIFGEPGSRRRTDWRVGDRARAAIPPARSPLVQYHDVIGQEASLRSDRGSVTWMMVAFSRRRRAISVRVDRGVTTSTTRSSIDIAIGASRSAPLTTSKSANDLLPPCRFNGPVSCFHRIENRLLAQICGDAPALPTASKEKKHRDLVRARGVNGPL